MLRGCFTRLLVLLVLLAAAALAWLNRDRIAPLLHRSSGVALADTASPELADRAVTKLESLGGVSASRVALGQAELQSLIAYRMLRSLPPYLHDPSVELSGNEMRVKARVPKTAMPDLPGAGDMVSLLPDTTEVAAKTQILPLGGGRIALAVDEISAARIPLPQRMIPSLLRRIGRRDEPGLPQDAIAVRLPNGVCSAYVHADSLVLLGRGGATDCR